MENETTTTTTNVDNTEVKPNAGETTQQTKETKVDTLKENEKNVPKKVETKEDPKVDTKEVPGDETKVDTKEEDSKLNELEQMKKKIEKLEKEQAKRDSELKAEKVRNTILEKVDNKELQKSILEAGLVKEIEDIDKIMKVIDVVRELNKNSVLENSYKPTDTKHLDNYNQAQSKGNVLDMIKAKLNKA